MGRGKRPFFPGPTDKFVFDISVGFWVRGLVLLTFQSRLYFFTGREISFSLCCPYVCQ